MRLLRGRLRFYITGNRKPVTVRETSQKSASESEIYLADQIAGMSLADRSRLCATIGKREYNRILVFQRPMI